MRKKKKYCIFIFLIIVLLYNWSEVLDDDILSREKCPACYGLDQCHKILKEDNFRFIGLSKWKLVNKLLNVKNVYYGETQSRTYVLKKLASNSQLDELDKAICRVSRTSYYNCNVSNIFSTKIEKYGNNLLEIMKIFKRLFKENDSLKCGQDEIVQFLYDKFTDHDRSSDKLAHFVTLMGVNPEPIIMQAFHGSFQMPLFLGSCGRVVIEEYAGYTLTHFYKESWITRAKLAIQLLKMAIQMTENEIRLYITDPSPDNFAVDKHGTIKMIDTENIVLLDSRVGHLDSSLHFNEGVGCKNCFSFDYEDLCGHVQCDHNYFAICKGLLTSKPFSSSTSGGLLHSIPSSVEKYLPIANVSAVIEECAMPQNSRDRRLAAKELLHLLIMLTKPEPNDSCFYTELKK